MATQQALEALAQYQAEFAVGCVEYFDLVEEYGDQLTDEEIKQALEMIRNATVTINPL